jgi:ABC-2 type transport system ATP-binding protein
MAVIELRGVHKRYAGRSALEGVDLTLSEGSALGLLGPNGAGKTTALRLVLGLLRPSEGWVRLNGMDPGTAESRFGVGYLPERLVLPGHMTIRSFLRLHGALSGLAGAELDSDLVRVAEQVGVASRLDDKVGELSKGLMQRVGFAQAFIGAPRLLLLDEPASGLDPIGMREARDWISAARRRGCTVLISSHLLSEVERLCDRVAILHEGRVRAEGAIDEIVQEGEVLEDAFMRLVGSSDGEQGI